MPLPAGSGSFPKAGMRPRFERAVKLGPKHLGAYYQLGLLYARNGEKEKSKDAMEMQRQLNAQLHKGLIALRMP